MTDEEFKSKLTARQAKLFAKDGWVTVAIPFKIRWHSTNELENNQLGVYIFGKEDYEAKIAEASRPRDENATLELRQQWIRADLIRIKQMKQTPQNEEQLSSIDLWEDVSE